VQGGLLLDVVVGESAAVLELLAGEDEALLVRRDALLVLDLGLHIVDGVGGLDLERDGLARQGLHEDLHGSRRDAAPLPRDHDVEERLVSALRFGFVTQTESFSLRVRVSEWERRDHRDVEDVPSLFLVVFFTLRTCSMRLRTRT
jgi:hypothetical protein